MQDDNRLLVQQFDPIVLDRALRLIRDRYGSSDKSVFFLELFAGVSAINSGIANQRDCFSHLVTLLKNPDFTKEEQYNQIVGMEEHLRRAVLEPPFIAAAKMWDRFVPVYDQYKKTVLTLPARTTRLPGVPLIEDIEGRIRAVLQLQEKARTGKGENRWDSEWELAVAEAVQAFTRLSELKIELEGYIAEAGRLREADTASKAARTNLWVGIVIGGVLALFVNWLFFLISHSS